MKTQSGLMIVTVVGWLLCAWRADAGGVLASNYVSVGYGYQSGWSTNETASANIPKNAPNPNTSFTVGDFRFRIGVGGTFASTAGPTFHDRILSNGGNNNTALSQSVVVVLTAQYVGPNPGYVNRIHLDVHEISIHAMAYTGASTNEIWWAETTAGNDGISTSVFLNVATDLRPAANYKKVAWNPPDASVQDMLAMTRTFCLPQQDPNFFVDGFEIGFSAWVERLKVPREPVTLLATTNFSIGYGWSGAWRTNETAAVNVPPTAPNPGSSFSMGDFLINISAAASHWGSVGPGFHGRVLGSGSLVGWSANGAVTVTASYTGSRSSANTGFRLNIDQISVYAAGDTAVSTTNAVWIETTPGNAATSPPVATLAGKYRFGGGNGSANIYSQISWNPAEPAVIFGAESTSMTRSFVMSPAGSSFPDRFLVDGLEVIGSVELLGPPRGTLIMFR